MKVSIIGAGFSGLTLAHYLRERGLEVDIFEKSRRTGGLIQTKSESAGMVETAANGLWNTPRVEELFAQLSLPMAPRSPQRKKRYIFRGKPRRWPVSLATALRLATRVGLPGSRLKYKPRADETIRAWALRIGNEEFLNYLLAPALQGIYAGDVNRMSAELILGRFFEPTKKQRAKNHGTVAPESGMGQLIQALSNSLRDRGVRIDYGVEYQLGSSRLPLVMATSAWEAAEYLRDQDPRTSEILARVDALPLVTVTAFFTETPSRYRGFGCLFPAAEKFNALGVLFNSDIFLNRSNVRSETWIFGGALDLQIVDASEEEILAKILADRRRLFATQNPLSFSIQRWPRALPHYTVEWKSCIERLAPKRGYYLTGNYLGALGLSNVLEFNVNLADRIAKDLRV